MLGKLFSSDKAEHAATKEVRNSTVPKRFEDQIYAHLVANYVPGTKSPLLLALHGPPGHGKSFQCSTLLDGWGVRPFYISGSELESPTAGSPANLVRERYLAASAANSKEGRACCVVIDDIDAGIGDFGGKTTYTVNRQNVSSLLMNLADRPNILDGQKVLRTPIIVTANNIESLYEPLRRPGRMTSYYWKMEKLEVRVVAERLFADGLSESDIDKLVSTYSDRPPAFFEQVRSEYTSARLAKTSDGEKRATFLRNMIIDPKFAETISATVAPKRDEATRNDIFSAASRIQLHKGSA